METRIGSNEAKKNDFIHRTQLEKPLDPDKEIKEEIELGDINLDSIDDLEELDPKYLSIIYIINKLLLEMAKISGEVANAKYDLLLQMGTVLETCSKIQQGIHIYSPSDFPEMEKPEERQAQADNMNRINNAFTEKIRQFSEKFKELSSRLRTSAESSSKAVDEFYKFIGDTLTTLSTIVMRMK